MDNPVGKSLSNSVNTLKTASAEEAKKSENDPIPGKLHSRKVSVVMRAVRWVVDNLNVFKKKSVTLKQRDIKNTTFQQLTLEQKKAQISVVVDEPVHQSFAEIKSQMAAIKNADKEQTTSQTPADQTYEEPEYASIAELSKMTESLKKADSAEPIYDSPWEFSQTSEILGKLKADESQASTADSVEPIYDAPWEFSRTSEILGKLKADKSQASTADSVESEYATVDGLSQKAEADESKASTANDEEPIYATIQKQPNKTKQTVNEDHYRETDISGDGSDMHPQPPVPKPQIPPKPQIKL